MLVLAKNNGTSDRHITFKNLYKYKWENTNVEPELFLQDVVDWEVISDDRESKIVFTKWRNTDTDKGYNIMIQRLDGDKSLIEIGARDTDIAIYRGVLSYLYSTQIFGGSKGFWQSPDGMFIVYMVTEINSGGLIKVPTSEGKNVSISYPRPGKNSPSVKMKVYSVELSRNVDADEPLDPDGKQDKYYVTAVSFPNAKKVLIEFMNQQQTRATTEECTLSQSPSCLEIPILKRSADQSWLPRYGAAAYGAEPFKEMQKYYVLRPKVVRQFNFTQLHRYDDPNRPNMKTPITNGMFDVTNMIGNDHTFRFILYIRTEKIDMTDKDTSVTRKRMLYMYDAVGNNHTCISCMEPKDRCDYATAEIDGTRQWYLVYCLGPSIPYNRIRKFGDLYWNLFADPNQNMMYENPSYQAQLMQKKRAWTQYTEVELERNSEIYNAVKKCFPLYYVRYLNILKWPLVIIVDPSPDKNMATMTYGLGLNQWLSIEKDAVVIKMDVKGTPGRGLAYHHNPYRDFNKIVDESAKTIKDIFRWWHVDRNKVAILGQGMGGWLALKLADRYPEWFKKVVVLDPILDFSEYFSAFSERYLDVIDKNRNAYLNSTVTFKESESNKNIAIYYNPYTTVVPHTAKYILENKDKFPEYNYFDVNTIKDKYDTSDAWLNIALNVTEFLGEGDNSVF